MRISALLVTLLCCVAPSLCQQDALLVSGFETLDGASMGWDAKNPDSKLALNADTRFVSEGTHSVSLQSVSPRSGAWLEAGGHASPQSPT